MNKRERKNEIKEIVELVDDCLKVLNEGLKDIANEAESKLRDFQSYLANYFVEPDSCDVDEILKDTLAGLIEYNTNANEIVERIDNFRDEVYEHIDGMREGVNKEEWEEFYANLECIEDVIDIESEYIQEIEVYIEGMQELKNRLLNLI